jgi:hypothetical protein
VHDERHEALLLELKPQEVVALMPQEIVVLPKLGAQTPELEGRLDTDDELGRADGLGEEVVAPGAQGTIERIDVARRREEEDRCLGAPGKATDALANGEPVEPGHTHVEQDALRVLSLEERDAFFSARCQDDAIPLVFEGVTRELTVRLVVVDNEDRGTRGLGSRGHGTSSTTEPPHG